MSIEKYGNIYTPTCDICGAEMPGEFIYNDAVAAKKRAGWHSRKDERGEWQDWCKECWEEAQRHDMD